MIRNASENQGNGKIAMKRLICIILALCLGLSLCACGQKAGEPAPTEAPEETPVLPTPEVALLTPEGEETVVTPPPTPDTRPSHRVEITLSNWETYFQLREIPLYSITSSGVIALQLFL